MQRRSFFKAAGAALATPWLWTRRAWAEQPVWDQLIVGAGTAGLPAAIFASRRGARSLLIDAADKVGGTLHLANGQVSGAGTTIQRDLGILDAPDIHFDDIMRITASTASAPIVRRVVDNAAATIDWLLAGGLVPLPDHPVTGESPGRAAYSRRRYLWGKNEGRDILAVVERQLGPELASGRVATQLNTRVSSLLVNDRGEVEGVRARQGERELFFRGKSVLLTSGGYASNPEKFRQLCGYPNYAGSSYAHSQGDGIDLATSVGGWVRGRELYRSGFGSILASETYPSKITARFHTVPQRRLPWEIWVGSNGERFVREDEPSQPARERALLQQPELRYWIVFDAGIFERAPPGVIGWTREQIHAAFDSHPMFATAPTLAALAERAGIDAAGLQRTVGAYNQSVRSKRDSLGRTHLPLAIRRGPFYAIRHQGHSASSVVGVAVDDRLRVLTAADEPVPNLYAAGELLGSGVMMGNAFCPGMLLTPALTFGRLLGSGTLAEK